MTNMPNPDKWITGSWGYDHPDNKLCDVCGGDADDHCPRCKGCLLFPDGSEHGCNCEELRREEQEEDWWT